MPHGLRVVFRIVLHMLQLSCLLGAVGGGVVLLLGWVEIMDVTDVAEIEAFVIITAILSVAFSPMLWSSYRKGPSAALPAPQPQLQQAPAQQPQSAQQPPAQHQQHQQHQAFQAFPQTAPEAAPTEAIGGYGPGGTATPTPPRGGGQVYPSAGTAYGPRHGPTSGAPSGETEASPPPPQGWPPQ